MLEVWNPYLFKIFFGEFPTSFYAHAKIAAESPGSKMFTYASKWNGLAYARPNYLGMYCTAFRAVANIVPVGQYSNMGHCAKWPPRTNFICVPAFQGWTSLDVWIRKLFRIQELLLLLYTTTENHRGHGIFFHQFIFQSNFPKIHNH